LWRAARRRPLVVSFPKAGRTWLRVMLDELGVDAEYTHFGAGVARALPADALAPRSWWYARRPTLLLIRDPRDTLVSSFHQATKRRHTYAGNLAAFVRDARFGIEKVVRWNAMWVEVAQAHPNVAIVSYEGLRAQGAPLVQAAARHLGAAPGDEAVRAAWQHANFDALRARALAGEVDARHRKILAPRDARDPSSFKVRKGVIGGYRDELAAEDIAYCDAVIAQHDYEARIAAALRERGLRPLG
jgi:hypothetical protein